MNESNYLNLLTSFYLYLGELEVHIKSRNSNLMQLCQMVCSGLYVCALFII